MMKKIVLFIFVLFSQMAFAKIFNMGKSSFGSYLRSTYSPWGNSQTPFSQSSGTGVSWNNGYTNMMSYEFGMLYNTATLTWRFGVEIFSPANLTGVTGKDSATNTTTYYTMDNTFSIVNPKIGIEVNLKTWPQSRLWMYFDYGLANLTLSNTFQFTAAGTAQFPTPGANFREEIKGNAGNYSAGMGFESLLSDNTTWCFELGYRMMQFSGLSHNVAANTFQGVVSSGGAANTNSGNGRDLSLSAVYAAFLLRIWVY